MIFNHSYPSLLMLKIALKSGSNARANQSKTQHTEDILSYLLPQLPNYIELRNSLTI